MTDYLEVMKENLDNQHDHITKHMAKAAQCLEYKKYDDASVHLAIVGILQDKRPSWKEIRDYEKESLSNLAESLTN